MEKKWAWIGGVTAAVTLALFVWAIAPKWASPAFNENAIAARMEVWAYWSMVTSMVSAVAASMSVAALVWTFREQRNVTLVQERAYVSVRSVRAEESSVDFTVLFELANTGRTPAQRCSLKLWLVVPTESNKSGKTQTPVFQMGRDFEIPPNDNKQAGARTLVTAKSLGITVPIVDTNVQRSKIPVVEGEITYSDVYGRRHTLPVRAEIWRYTSGVLLLH